jgi:hypothetical protein
MKVEFCPSCGNILQIVPMIVSGITCYFWVCPEGDWESPAPAPASAEAEISVAGAGDAP